MVPRIRYAEWMDYLIKLTATDITLKTLCCLKIILAAIQFTKNIIPWRDPRKENLSWIF
jgi:hypothetical protein